MCVRNRLLELLISSVFPYIDDFSPNTGLHVTPLNYRSVRAFELFVNTLSLCMTDSLRKPDADLPDDEQAEEDLKELQHALREAERERLRSPKTPHKVCTL